MLVAVFIVSLILSFTSVGFPYSDNKTAPRLQRFRVINTRRTFYDENGIEKFKDIGFLLSTIDRNSIRTLESSFDPKDLTDWVDDEKCSEQTYCGFPMYRFSRGRYLKGSEEPTVQPSQFTKVSSGRDPNNPSQVRVEFTAKLSTLTMIYMTPGTGWTFVNSSMPSSNIAWRDQSFRLTKITYGKHTEDLLSEFVSLEGSPGADPSNVVTITVATVESAMKQNQEFVNVMKKFPDYTFAMEQQADVSVYQIKED